MNSAEATRIFDELVEMLVGVRLGWVVEQVRQQIAAGKEVTKRVTVESDDSLYVARRRGQTVSFASTMEFDHEEQLGILVKAIEQAIVGTADMEHEMLEPDSKYPAITEVRFESEMPGIDGSHFTLTSTEARMTSAHRLQALCDEIKKEIESGN